MGIRAMGEGGRWQGQAQLTHRHLFTHHCTGMAGQAWAMGWGVSTQPSPALQPPEEPPPSLLGMAGMGWAHLLG